MTKAGSIKLVSGALDAAAPRSAFKKRAAQRQKPVSKRANITQAQADAAVRWYFSQLAAK
ncbi:MAG: hypothetical protein Q7U20_08140 [Caulobacter sp.]|nr:hypothetical protein [Caulobacter sp.]